ncbi:MAG: hypothetical protein AAFW81_12585, partial [Pseudomonadota bacterium]
MSRVRILAALIAASSAATVTATASAQEPEAETAAEHSEVRINGAIDFAKALTADATVALTDENADAATRLSNFQVVLAEGLALDTIGKFMLGESRKVMTDEQTARYEAVFPDYI